MNEAREKAYEALAVMQQARAVALNDRMSRYLQTDSPEPSRASAVDAALKDILTVVTDTRDALRWREDLPSAGQLHAKAATQRPRSRGAGACCDYPTSGHSCAKHLTVTVVRPWSRFHAGARVTLPATLAEAVRHMGSAH